MRITHSTAADRASSRKARTSGASPILELAALLVASLLSVLCVWLVYGAKASEASTAAKAAARPVLDLNAVDRAEPLLPVLEEVVPDPAERRFVADRIAGWLTTPDGAGNPRRTLTSVGSLGTIRVSDTDLKANRRLPSFRQRIAERREALVRSTPDAATVVSVPLLTSAQLAALRPALVVRSWTTFRNELLFACGLFLAAFYAVWVAAAVRRLSSDPWLLPAVHVLCGIGLAMMVSLRDPLRDAWLFPRFAQGVAAGLVALALVRLVDFQRSQLRRLSYVPLLGAVALSAVLVVFGSGPGTSDAKVNLLGVQPVEAIRVLVVLFLAGYFANRWELLRSLKEPRLGRAARFGFDVPRLDYLLPVIVGMALVLVFFFLQKDLGPALVLACVFLAMYGVARQRLTMVAVGLLLLGSGFVAGYFLGYPHTVVQRVQMWVSPWDNVVRGGDQVAHALWGLSAGALFGTGLGLGDPQVIPAGHTDLVLAVVGEELGFAGILVVFALFAFVAWRCLRIALRAPGDYTFFLALGLTLGLVLQAALIAAGLLGLMPLTGVATPFLSYGRSSMIANLAALGIIQAIAARSTGDTPKAEFERPAKWLAVVVGALLVAAVTKAAAVQVVHPDATLIASALSVQADGERRFEYNPRLLAVAQLIDRGTILDRNGVPLATSRSADLAAHASDFTRLGVVVPAGCASEGARCYPFGGLTYHLLGDFRTQANWAASNTSFVERDSDVRLRGYDDHARVVEVSDPRTGAKTRVLRRDLTELIPLLRHRRDPNDESVKRLLARPRDVRMSVDVRLQLKLGEIVKSGVEKAGRNEGAAVVLSGDGDLLAAVSYPWPLAQAGGTPASEAGAAATRSLTPEERQAALIDRVRYGVYPPGSSFKLVTASAALRKDPSLLHRSFTCERLPDGRVGQKIPGWGRPIRDDPADKTPHGTLDMERGLVVSCNAYFAQLGLAIGAQALQETADLYEIAVAPPGNARALRDTLPFAAYGQGQVLASPLKMARVAATIAGGGSMPQGRWVIDDTNQRVDAPRPVLSAADAVTLARAMREVVVEGTGRSLKGIDPPVAGKTGTAEVQDAPSHSWFVGFAPYGEAKRRIAFAVIVEHGGYGASAAAPIAGRIVATAKELGLFQ